MAQASSETATAAAAAEVTLPADVDLHARPAADFVRTAMRFDVRCPSSRRRARGRRQEPALGARARRTARHAPAPARRRARRRRRGAGARRDGRRPSASRSPSSRWRDRGLRRRDPCDRDPQRRARDVVEAGGVEERDRVWIAAVLAADPELQPRVGLAADPRSRAAPATRLPACRSSRTASGR